MTETALHFVSKIGWWLFAPGNLVFLGLLIGTALIWTKWRGLGRVLVTAVTVSCTLIAVLPLSDWAVAPLEDRFPQPATLPDRITGIITLGGMVNPKLTKERRQVALMAGAERLTEFVALARRYPDAQLVFTGGSGSLRTPDLKEAPAARQFLVSLGFDAARVLFEDRSRNTYENATLTRKLVNPTPGDRWILITSALHMPRSVGVFRATGWNVIPYPVDYLTEGRRGFRPRFDFQSGVSMLAIAAREWIALVVYRMVGRTAVLLPAPGGQPARG